MVPFSSLMCIKVNLFSLSHDHIEVIINSAGDYLFFKQRDGPYYPSLRLIHKCKNKHTKFVQLNRHCSIDPFICPLMQVDKGAITFVLSGANIMCPGLTSKGAIMTAGLPANAVVTVIAEGKKHALSVGILKMSVDDM